MDGADTVSRGLGEVEGFPNFGGDPQGLGLVAGMFNLHESRLQEDELQGGSNSFN